MSKKVMMISEHASPLEKPGAIDCGGQNVYVGNIALELARRGYAVDVFVRREDPRTPEIIPWESGIRVINVSAGPQDYVPKESLLPFMQEFRRRCAAYIEANQYDLIHANFWMSGLVGLELKKLFDIPLVVTFHALGKVRRIHQAQADGFPDERFTIEETLCREADALIAECPQDAEDLQYLYGALPEHIALIPCGVDLSLFRPVAQSLARETLALPPHDDIVLQLGRLVPRKGIDTVIDALAVMKRVDGQCPFLVIVGGDSDVPNPENNTELKRLMRHARDAGLYDRVRFVGRKRREDLKWYYSAADVFVTTPWYEPFGITPLEAMACGVPVIGSRVGGIRYTVDEGVTGDLVPPRAPTALAGAIRLLLDQPERRRAYANAGQRRVREHFTWGHVVDKLQILYERLIDEDEVPHIPDERMAEP